MTSASTSATGSPRIDSPWTRGTRGEKTRDPNAEFAQSFRPSRSKNWNGYSSNRNIWIPGREGRRHKSWTSQKLRWDAPVNSLTFWIYEDADISNLLSAADADWTVFVFCCVRWGPGFRTEGWSWNGNSKTISLPQSRRSFFSPCLRFSTTAWLDIYPITLLRAIPFTHYLSRSCSTISTCLLTTLIEQWYTTHISTEELSL